MRALKARSANLGGVIDVTKVARGRIWSLFKGARGEKEGNARERLGKFTTPRDPGLPPDLNV